MSILYDKWAEFRNNFLYALCDKLLNFRYRQNDTIIKNIKRKDELITKWRKSEIDMIPANRY